ncbi:hypothetical protein AXW38_05840 [Yersinia ruckeri]|nr:hypothetical protein AXW19_05830 [Yersinia ruckeri]OIX35421.1 hypothetical protein AXW20_05825 [Yersinia ruckeri]OIX35707.1 hypothetical protein AXW18_05835 [Yersinia ruckeri]OIX42999.1 hypothetical protein AXW21_05825 [Yersinia ruckeri]OIX43202.1 hypothetical protein AXW23_05810 [Yersinia ruckeri]
MNEANNSGGLRVCQSRKLLKKCVCRENERIGLFFSRIRGWGVNFWRLTSLGFRPEGNRNLNQAEVNEQMFAAVKTGRSSRRREYVLVDAFRALGVDA